MKNLNFFKKGFTGLIFLFILSIVGTEIFQGQKVTQPINENIFNYDESDPYIDRPTREALSHVTENTDDDLDIITDANGFDNFEIGVDMAEQMLVSNPLNPLNMQFGVNSAAGQNAYYTTDGYTWISSNPAYHPSICCDPWSAWDGLGRLVYGSGVSGEYTYRSTTGAVYLAAVLAVSGNDRNTLAAEQTNSGPNPNYFYAAITPGNFARSLNGGATWTTTYSPINDIPGVMIAVGPNGVDNGDCIIYVTNTGVTENVTYTFHRSLDGGATFTVRSSLTTAGYVGTLNAAGRLVINNGRTRPYPMIAMDNSNGTYRGRLYLVYASNVPAGNGNKPDIRLRYSDNQALTWSAPVTVNDNVNPSLSDQWFPAIWCEKQTGRLYLKWYDTRDNPAAYGVHVMATYTDDGGATFAPNQRLTNAIWTYPNPACAPNTNCYRGDYDGCTANPKTSFNVWYDGRLGTYKNVGAYFPDFGMLATPAANTVHQTNSSVNYLINIPAVKLYTDVTTFSASVSPAPAAGSIQFEFLGGNTLSSYPSTKYMKVKTVGTVTAGAYTITITGQGSNGTPVHKRTVGLTVNTTVGPTICESFTDAKFPPPSMFEEYSGTNYWSRNTVSAYGFGTGSAKFEFYSAPVPTVQSLVSNNFPNTAANTYLTFDNAYAPFGSPFGPDTLVVQTSANFGGTYTTLVTLLGKADGTGELNTAPPQGTEFTPTSSQWRPKIYPLPIGTNKIRLIAKSGFGNNLYLDNICVQVLSAPLAQSISIIQEGFYNTVLNNLNMSDTVRFYLHRREIGLESVVMDSAISVVNASTFVAPTTFPRALSGSYYLIAKHRNCILTWSSQFVAYSYVRGGLVAYNFTTAASQAFGSNMKLVDTSPSTRYGIYSGDVDQDGVIDVIDLGSVYNDAQNSVSGYVSTDVNGDGFVDVIDLGITYNNQGVAVEDPLPAPSPSDIKNSKEDKDHMFWTEFERKKNELGLRLKENPNLDISKELNSLTK